MNKHTISLFGSAKSDDWATPTWLYEQLDREFHFTFDPCPLNSTFDGLACDWIGTIFCNPPYSKVKHFLKKAREEIANGNAEVIVFLVFSKTDTAWFHDYILGKAEIRFLKGRLTFQGAKNPAMWGNMLVIFRQEVPPCGR